MKRVAIPLLRVSSVDQLKGLSLDTQLERIRTWCATNGYEMGPWFGGQESGRSELEDRRHLARAIAYCQKHRSTVGVLVVYMLDRFARNTDTWSAAKQELRKASVVVRSVVETHVDETPLGRAMGTLHIALGQLQGDLNRERVIENMKRAAGMGRWVWAAPLGYRNWHSDDGRVKRIVHDPERAPLIRRGFEEVATGQWSAAEVLARLAGLGLTTKRGDQVARQHWSKILRQPAYAGRIVVTEWGIDVAGDFEPLVTAETWSRAQMVLDGRALAPRKALDRPEFPLRRFCRCGLCETPLTASFSRSHTGKRHPYYHCRACGRLRVKGADLEQAFYEMVGSAQPQPAELAAFRVAIEDAWRRRGGDVESGSRSLDAQAQELRRRKQKAFEAWAYREAIGEDDYRAEASRLDDELAALAVRLADLRASAEPTLAGAWHFAEELLGHAADRWLTLAPADRREFQLLLFPAGIDWTPDRGFRTPATCPLFKGLAANDAQNARVVDQRFEPSNLEAALPFIARAAEFYQRVSHAPA